MIRNISEKSGVKRYYFIRQELEVNMIVVTGGAGFIGSSLIWHLNKHGIDDIIVVDRLGKGEKWRNLVSLRYAEYFDKEEFIDRLESGFFDENITAILHLGACSSTTEKDADYLAKNNYQYSVRLGKWWEKHNSVRFIYASSAATYGDGSMGYVDDEGVMDKLRPLNMYGYSKQMFDLYAMKHGWLRKMVAIKYFNVFGPNEYHKADMRSVVNKAFVRARDEGVISLFKSYRPEYGDGQQLRDFIYVKDAVRMTLFFMDKPDIGGVYNIGTGIARSWNDLAKAIFSALEKEPSIEYIPMPEELKGKYQYFTEADLRKLKAAGCDTECMKLEDSVRDYVCNYLKPQLYLDPQRQDT